MKKKRIFIWLIIVIVLLVIVSFWFIERGDSDEKTDGCVRGEDCVKVQLGCCPCNMGGEEKCVPKFEEKFYLEKLENCSVNTICAAVDNCKIKSCDCSEGECIENGN